MDILVVGLVALSVTLSALLLATRAELTRLRDDLDLHIEHGMHAVGARPPETPFLWPEGCPLQPGQRVPDALTPMILQGGGSWTLVVFQDRNLLDGHPDALRDVRSFLSARYEVLIISLDELDAAAPPWTRVLPTALRDAHFSPSVLMVDPEGVVQGTGFISSPADILRFVVEGEQHGFGAPGVNTDVEHRPVRE